MRIFELLVAIALISTGLVIALPVVNYPEAQTPTAKTTELEDLTWSVSTMIVTNPEVVDKIYDEVICEVNHQTASNSLAEIVNPLIPIGYSYSVVMRLSSQSPIPLCRICCLIEVIVEASRGVIGKYSSSTEFNIIFSDGSIVEVMLVIGR